MLQARASIRSLALAGGLALAGIHAARADGPVRVEVLDRDGDPVPEVVVYARQASARNGSAAEHGTAIMNQHGLAFEPHILVVETGTRIEFANTDDVNHHVYSFSPAKTFDFSVESGEVREALAFDVPGTVTLGCNIHDDMLAYILVVDTPLFAKTGGDGVARFDRLPAGHYEITIWTPRVAKKNLPAPIVIDLAADETLDLSYRFETRLFPAHAHSETSLSWSKY